MSSLDQRRAGPTCGSMTGHGWRWRFRNGRDPYLVASKGHPTEVAHFWVAKVGEKLRSGVHVIHVRTIDMFGQRYEAARLLRVTE